MNINGINVINGGDDIGDGYAEEEDDGSGGEFHF